MTLVNKRGTGRLTGIGVAVLLLLLWTGLIHAMPADPNARIEEMQPDGTTHLVFRLLGDERTGRYATEDGYTVVKGADGYWQYAVRDADGELAPSGRRVQPVDKRTASDQVYLNTLDKYIAPNSSRIRMGPGSDITKASPELLRREGGRAVNNVLIILIDFPDHANTYPASDFSDLMNLNGFDGYGSVNDYYQEVSYGQFGVSGTTTIWYTAANNRSYYGWVSSGTPNWNKQAELAKEAVVAAKTAGVNFAPFDNDGDGEVDGLFIVHAGPGAEVVGSGWPWSHKWNFVSGTGSSVSASGKTINNYTLEPEEYNFGTRATIGVFAHEYGHAIGLPDLYDTDYSSIGIGKWCLMSFGSYNGPSSNGRSPAHMSAWCKAQLGWLTPSNVTFDLFGWTIADVETTPTVFRLWTAGAMGNEYFLVEYRRQVLFDTYLPGCGVAIWHIDDSKTSNASDADRWVDLEEADNTENSSAGDMYVGGIFNGFSTPNSNSKAGAATQVSVIVISSMCSPNGMIADLQVGVNPPPVEIMIRDCPSDIGNEPDNECASVVKSSDIYIDNNFDNIIDPPAPGFVNQIYFIARNIGTNNVAGTQLNAYFVNPSLGLYFPGMATPIADFYSAATTFNYPTIFSGSNQRVFINWLIPAPPPSIDHYCIGAVLNTTGDMQFNQYPRNDNNVAQINMWALYQKAGQIAPSPRVNKSAPQDTTLTVFHSIVQACNNLGGATNFMARITQESMDSLPPGWEAMVENPGPYFLLPDSCVDVHVYLYANNPQHNDSALVDVELYPAQNPEVVTGAGALAYCIDSYAAKPVDDLQGQVITCPDDNLDACNPIMLEWDKPRIDVVGQKERIRWFYVFCDTIPGVDEQDLYDSTAMDMDPNRSGFQWFDKHILKDNEHRYYRVASVDGAFSPSELGNEVMLANSCCIGLRGNANGDAADDVNISDLTYLVAYLFQGGAAPPCPEEGDVDGTGSTNVSDLTYLVAFLFQGGPAPQACP